MPVIDMHVHIVGTGAGGTGCWMRSGGWRAPIEALMCRHMGLPRGAFQGDFDALYVGRLLELVRSSGLHGAAILAMDNVYAEDGRMIEGFGTFYVPNAYVLDLAARHPEFLPAVSIHPARPDAMDELEQCLAGGAVMLKLLPNCHNVNCNDRRYQKFWERVAEAGLPFLAHTGGEHTVPVANAAYASPAVLELPLECGVTVIAAHAGTRSGLADPDYFDLVGQMMLRYPRLYADNSALNIPIRSRAFRASNHPPYVDRMIHGSDFPVLTYPHWAWMRGLIGWRDFRQANRERNVLRRDVMIKRAIGVPEAIFERGAELLRKSRS